MHDLSSSTRLVRDTCIVRITIDGHSMNFQVVPSTKTLVTLADQEIPQDMIERKHAQLIPKTDVIAPVPVVENSKKNILQLLSGGFKLIKSEFGIGASEKSVFEQRKKICLGCDKYDFGKCIECGCFLYAKAKIDTEKCPLGKWNSK